MTSYHFHLEVLAPNGLKGIESFLYRANLPLEAKTSGFNGKVILRDSCEDDFFNFDMTTSTEDVMHASGNIAHSVEQAWAMLLSLSQALTSAGFPHLVGLDVGERMLTVSFNCELWRDRRWVSA
ncbi:MAG: hypothetical protein ACN6OP_21690 [Pseudomonadales bacterium]